MCGYHRICVAVLSILVRLPQHRQYPQGAISPPASPRASHLSPNEINHENSQARTDSNSNAGRPILAVRLTLSFS